MFLDEDTTDVLVEGNLIHDISRSPLRFHRAGENLVRGNRLVVGPDLPPVRCNATSEANVRLEGNTVLSSRKFDASTAESLLPQAGPRPPHRERLSLP